MGTHIYVLCVEMVRSILALKFIALELSLNTIYSSCLTPSSRRNLFIHSISLATSVVAMASAFLPPPLWPGRGREG